MDKPSYRQLRQKYEEAMDVIADIWLELRSLRQEVDDYYQVFEKRQEELAENERKQ